MAGPSGDGESEWKRIVIGRAQRRVSTDLRRLLYNDFDTETSSEIETSGSGSVGYDLSLSGGHADLQTGTGLVIPNYAIVFNAGSNKLIASVSGASWYVHCRARVTVECDVNSVWDFIGLQDTEYVAFGVLGSVSTTLLNIRLSAITNVTSAIAVDIGNENKNDHEYDMGFNFAAGTLSAWVDDDDEPVATTSVLTDLTAQACRMYSYVGDFAGVGTTNKQLIVDRQAVVVA